MPSESDGEASASLAAALSQPSDNDKLLPPVVRRIRAQGNCTSNKLPVCVIVVVAVIGVVVVLVVAVVVVVVVTVGGDGVQ